MNGHLRKNLMQQRAKVIAALRTDPELSARFARSVDEAMGAFDAWQFANSINADLQNAFTSAAFSQLDLEASFGEIISDDAIEFQENRLPQIAEKRAEDRLGVIDGIGNQIAAKLNEQILEGYDNGENLTQVTDRVRKVFNVGLSRARTIARTEATIMTVGGAQAQADANGMKFKKWIAHEDEFTRESHSQAQREGWIPAEEPFKATGSMRPGDGSAAEVVNCRCALRWSNKNRNKPAEDKPQKGTETKAKDAVAEPPATSKVKPWDDPDLYYSEVSDEEFMKIKMDGIMREIDGEGHAESLDDRFSKIQRESDAERGNILAEMDHVNFQKDEAIGKLKPFMIEKNELKKERDRLTVGFADPDQGMKFIPANISDDEKTKITEEFDQKIAAVDRASLEVNREVEDLMKKSGDLLSKSRGIEAKQRKRERDAVVEMFGNPKAKPLDHDGANAFARDKLGFEQFPEGDEYISKMYGDKYRYFLEEVGLQKAKSDRAYYRDEDHELGFYKNELKKVQLASVETKSKDELHAIRDDMDLAQRSEFSALLNELESEEGASPDLSDSASQKKIEKLKRKQKKERKELTDRIMAVEGYKEGGKYYEKLQSVYVHEMGHAVECASSKHSISKGGFRRPNMIERSMAFQDKRQVESFGLDADGKMRPAVTLRSLNPDRGYGKDEKTLEDSWKDSYRMSVYAGKRNEHPSVRGEFADDSDVYGTELHTMASQRLYDDPKLFLEDDFELFALTIGNFRGDFDDLSGFKDD